MQQQEFTRANGVMTSGTELASRDLVMGTLTKALTRMAKSVGRAGTCGARESSMKENGRMDIRKAMESGKVLRTILTSESGVTINLTGLASISGAAEISMKASGRHVSDTARAATHLRWEMFMWVSTAGARLKATGSIHGPMGTRIVGSSMTVRRTDRATGAKAEMRLATSTQGHTRMTRNMVTVSSRGRPDRSIVEIT